MNPSRPADDFGLRLAIYYACLFLILGIQLPFFPLWLEARGLDPQAIGIVLSMPIAIRIVAIPLLNRAIDRRGDLRISLIAASFAGAAGFFVVGFAHGFAAILLSVGFASLISCPLMSLSDAYALKGLGARRRAYGSVRLWGSAAFIATNIGSGLLLAVMSADRLIWLIAAAFVLLGAASLWLRPLEQAPADETNRKPSRGHLWRSPRFLAIAAAASLIQASHALYNGFSAVDWTAKDIGSTTIGILWGLGVAAEIVLFALSGRLSLSPASFLAIGATAAVIRWIAMAFNPPLVLLPLVQCLHGLSFGATHIGSIQFIARTAGERQAATAQGDFATILSIGSALAIGTSGLLYNTLGDYGYAVMAALATLGGICLIPALRVRASG